MTDNLCMYCGGVGHKASDCNKASFSAMKAKGHAAKVETPTTPAAPSGKNLTCFDCLWLSLGAFGWI